MQYKIKYFFLDNFYINNIIDFIKARKNFFQLIDSKTIISEVQIINAINKTIRYTKNNKKFKYAGNLLLLYLSYTSQIDKAINKIGIKNSTVNGIVIYENDNDFKEFLNLKGIKIIERNIPYDLNNDFDVFSKMSYIDLLL